LLVLLVLPLLLWGQGVSDSALASSAPRLLSTLDRYTIDVATIVRDGTALELSDVLISRIPGLLVVPGSGLTGGGAQIRFAGVRSLIADQPPLVFLDGIRIDAREDDSQMPLVGPAPSRIDDIPVEEVATVEVLRGPATTAVYGPGAAAGVILIHSKQGGSGAVRVSGFAQGTVRAIPARWPTNYGGVDLDNANAYMRQGECSLAAQANGACVQDYVQSFNPLIARNPFASAPRGQLGLSATGGPRWGSFRVAGTIDGDAVPYDVPAVNWSRDSRNWNLRASGVLHPVPNLDISTSVGRISSTLRLPMYEPVLNALTGPSDSTGFTWTPFFHDPGTQTLDRTQFAVTAQARLITWLSVRAALGLDDLTEDEIKIIPSAHTTGDRSATNRTLAFSATSSNLAWRGMRFTTTIGVEHWRDRGRDSLLRIQPGTGCGSTACSWSSQTRIRRVRSLGVYGVEQIEIGKRLLVTGTLRHDAIEDYLPWSATHANLAIDWIARQTSQSTLGQVTLHAAYGSSSQAPANDMVPLFYSPLLAPPPRPQAEFTRGVELSATATALAGKVRAEGTYYDSRSRVLMFGYVSGATGYYQEYFSGSAIGNRGVGATISSPLVDRPSVGWDLRLSLWGNRNRMVKLVPGPLGYAGPYGPTGQQLQQGYPANGYWGRPIVSFADTNGDGIVTSSEVVMGSYTWMGTPYPTQGAALMSTWRFARRWRVSATLDYRAGQTLFNQIATWRCEYARCPASVVPGTPLAAQATAVTASMLPSAYYEDADYLKLRELAIAFDLPERAAALFGARAATVVFGGRDLATWTKYSGADPEAASYGVHSPSTPMAIGDVATVPLARTWTLRVRVSY